MKLTEVPPFSDHNSAFNNSPSYPCILLGGFGNITKCYPGMTNKTEIKGPFKLSFQKGKRYLLRVINTSYGAGYTFSIDNHEMCVVSADFVPITPYCTTAIRVNIGQRYNIVVKANPINSSDTNFWIRTYQTCGEKPKPTLGPEYMNTGIITYDNSTRPDPTSTQWPNANSTDCKDEPLQSIIPIVRWKLPGPSNSDVPRIIKGKSRPTKAPYLHFAINAINSSFQPLQVKWGDPTFINLQNTNWPNLSVIVPEDFSANFDNVTSFTSMWVSFSPLLCTIVVCLAKITYQIYLNITSGGDHPVSQIKSDYIS
jgi:FtsP/CotA-like multicopper oxidase with cupredoxin domain